MSHQTIYTTITATILSIILLLPVFSTIAAAYETSHPSADDLWNVLECVDDKSVWIYNLLKEEGMVDNRVTYEEFDYIFVLTHQLSLFSTNVPFPLVLAMIAQESKFYQHDEYDGAIGLMQLLPIYHQTRLEKYVEAGHQVDLDDFYDPRLNIATGIDYMDELLEGTHGDIKHALMCYNQGVVSANKDWASGYVSKYANRIYELSFKIEQVLEPLE